MVEIVRFEESYVVVSCTWNSTCTLIIGVEWPLFFVCTPIFSCRNQQAEMLTVGGTLHITGGKVDMFKGTMRLAVSKSGTVESSSTPISVVKEEINMSSIEFDEIEISKGAQKQNKVEDGEEA